MKKKKAAVATLALAGAISVTGALGLQVSMAHNMKEEQVTEVEHLQESAKELGTEVDVQEKTNQADEIKAETVNQVWQENENIYLPEGAEIVSNSEGCYEIAWDNCNISYKHWSNETQEDLGLGKLKPIIEETVEKYTGQDLGDCYMEIFLEDPAAYDVENGNNDAGLYPDIDYDADDVTYYDEENGCVAVIETEDGVIHEILVDAVETVPEEVRDMYSLDSKCYQAHILTDNQRYDIWVDSLTGEVTVFNYEDETFGTFTNGWDITREDGSECQLSDEEQKEYDAIIEAFVADDLGLGNVEKIYSQDADVSYYGVSGNNIRAYYTVVCKTDEGAVVEVSFDIGEKTVTSFRTSAQYLSE